MNNQSTDYSLLRVFNALSEIPLRCREKKEALRQITELSRKALGSQACTLTSVDFENKFLVQEACAGLDQEFQHHMADRKIRLGSPVEGDFLDFDLVRAAGVIEKLNLQEPGNGVANPEIASKYNLHSVLCYPLKTEDTNLLGYLNHFSARSLPFSEAERELLEVFARQAVLTIERFDQYNKLNYSARLEKLNEMMRQMTEARSVDDLLELVLDQGLDLVGCTRGWISRLNLTRGTLDVVAYSGSPNQTPILKIGEGITGQALKEEGPIKVDDVLAAKWKGIYRKFWDDTRSELAIPILINNAEVRVGRDIQLATKPIGILNLESPLTGAFTKADQEILSSLASHLAVLIDRLEFDLKLSDLAEIEREIVGKRDWDEVIEIVLDGITDTLAYEIVNISLVYPELNRIKTEYIRGIPEDQIGQFKRQADHDLDSEDIQADIVRLKEIEVPELDDSRFDDKIFESFDHHQLIRVFIPMIASSNDQVIGTVEAGYNRIHRPHIYERDVQILKEFVDYATVALEQRKQGLLDEISHELTAPIVGIQNNISFIRSYYDNLSRDRIHQKLDYVLDDCEILLMEVGELEYILGRAPQPSKIEKIRVFKDVIIKAIYQLKSMVEERKFSVNRIEYSHSDVNRIRIYADVRKLSRVAYNLLINSIKYAEDDPLAFTIRISVDDAKDNFIIKFKDWGIGIRKGLEDKIFERGFRTPEARMKHVSGSGLGLSIAKEIMAEMGGDLKLVNGYKPTEFHLLIPKMLREKPE